MRILLTSILYLFSLGLATTCYAQNLAGTTVLLKPTAYTKPVGPSGKITSDASTSRSKMWIVFSDRKDNSSYTSETLGAVKKKLDYLQAYLVIGKKGNSLRIVKHDHLAYYNGKLTSQAQDYGWVDQKNMLLWDESLINTNTKIVIKGLAVFNASVLKSPEAYFKSNNVRIFNNPDLAKSNVQEKSLTMFQFVYIYKEENGAYLVGKESDVTTNNSARTILGWVDQKTIQKWEGRLCLEPNKFEEAVNERKSTETKVSIFGNQANATSYSQGTDGVNAIWDKDPQSTYIHPGFKRFPILEESSPGIYKTGFSTPLIDENGVTLSSVNDKLNFDTEYFKARDDRKNVNVIFVIDGNPENKPFVHPIIKTIQLNYDYLKSGRSENNYTFGSVIYRKNEYKTCSNGDKSMEVVELSSQYKKLTDALASTFDRELCEKGNLAPETNFYSAVDRACRMLSGKEKQTNIIIILGSASTTTSALNISTLAAKTSRLYASIIGFQVNNGADIVFENFYDDLRNLVLSNSRNIVNGLKGNAKLSPELKGKLSSPTWGVGADNYNSFLDMDKSPVFGSLTFAERNQIIPLEKLSRELKRAMVGIEKWNNNLIADLDAKFQGIGESDVKVNPSMILFLKQSGINLSNDILNQITKNSYQFYVEGYTPYEQSKLTHPLYSYQLLMQHDEYYALLNNFTRLADSRRAENTSATRKRLRKTYMDLISAYEGKNEIATRKMTIAQANQLIAGIPANVQTETIKSVRIDDILDDKLFPDTELNKVLNSMSHKVSRLKTVRIHSDLSFTNFNEVMYWVPVDFLP